MNKLLLILSLATTISFTLDAHSSEIDKLSNIYYGSKIVFVTEMPLVQGEEAFSFLGKTCTLELDKPVKGKVHIPKGAILVVDEIETVESSTYRNIGNFSSLKIASAKVILGFEKTDSYISCDTDDDFSITIDQFNQNGVMRINLQEESRPFLFN